MRWGDWERLAKEHIYIAHRHNSVVKARDGKGGKEREMWYICNSVNNKKKQKKHKKNPNIDLVEKDTEKNLTLSILPLIEYYTPTFTFSFLLIQHLFEFSMCQVLGYRRKQNGFSLRVLSLDGQTLNKH